eukprot:7376656-Prymnesium_polylepis.1
MSVTHQFWLRVFLAWHAPRAQESALRALRAEARVRGIRDVSGRECCARALPRRVPWQPLSPWLPCLPDGWRVLCGAAPARASLTCGGLLRHQVRRKVAGGPERGGARTARARAQCCAQAGVGLDGQDVG